jgi:hypothetical protein
MVAIGTAEQPSLIIESPVAIYPADAPALPIEDPSLGYTAYQAAGAIEDAAIFQLSSGAASGIIHPALVIALDQRTGCIHQALRGNSLDQTEQACKDEGSYPTGINLHEHVWPLVTKFVQSGPQCYFICPSYVTSTKTSNDE